MCKGKLGRTLTVVIWAILTLSNLCHASPPGGRIYPKANEEATEKLKEAYAAYHQGWYDKAIELAMEVYRKYGDVHARWWPAWVKRLMKGNLPDPHNHGAILGVTIEGKAPLTMMVNGVTTVWLLSRAYLEAGRYEELMKAPWGDPMLKGIASLHLKRGDRLPQPPSKNTWRPLPLRFREEDYFILVPLDEACKVLGLSLKYVTDAKTGKKIGAHIGGKKKPLLFNKPSTTLPFVAYEEQGIVWIAFYWLAKEAGVRWWEVRNGKIYIAPNQGTK